MMRTRQRWMFGLAKPWWVVPAAVLWLLPLLGKAAEEPKAVEIVVLERKEPALYDKDIVPIFENKCLSCHSGNAVRGRLDMSSYETVMKGGKSGPAVLPGKSAASKMVLLAGRTEQPVMPPKQEHALSPQELALVKLWIDQGAKAPMTVRERPKVTLSDVPPQVQPIRSLSLSADAVQLVVGRGRQVEIFDVRDGKITANLVDQELKTLAHASLVESVALSPGDKYIASGSFKEVKIWNAQSGELLAKLVGFADRVTSLAFSGDGKLLAAGGGPAGEDGEIKVFEVPGWKEVLAIERGHSDTVFCVRFSPDSKLLASGSADKFVKVFELEKGKTVHSLEGHTHHVLDVDWQADGKRLVSAGADNAIKLWNLETGEQIRTINGHAKEVTGVAFVAGSPTLVSCSGDQTVRFWNRDNGRQARSFNGGPDFLHALALTKDGKTIMVGCEDGRVRILNGDNGRLLRTLPEPDKK